MHEVLVNHLGGLSLPRKSVVRLTDRPDMTVDVYHGRKTTMQQCNNSCHNAFATSASSDKTVSAFHLFRVFFAIKSAKLCIG